MDWLQWLALGLSLPGAIVNIALILQAIKQRRADERGKQQRH